jgi:hypothetical protein
MDNKIFLNLISDHGKYQLDKITNCNQYTEKFGLHLSKQDASFLLASRASNLKEQERIEFGEGILAKLIFTFCDSPYIYQDNYIDTLEALQEMFYLYKNESLDELTDDELLEYMKEHFDGDCQGSLDYLEESCLDSFCRQIRRNHYFMGDGQDEE